MEKMNCIECGLTFHGRSDKKFCTDHCRSTYNNKRNTDVNELMKSVNYSLRKNRRILVDLLINGKERVDSDYLFQRGFSLKYSTHNFTSNNGKQYKFWYDHGLLMENDAYYILRDGDVK